MLQKMQKARFQTFSTPSDWILLGSILQKSMGEICKIYKSPPLYRAEFRNSADFHSTAEKQTSRPRARLKNFSQAIVFVGNTYQL